MKGGRKFDYIFHGHVQMMFAAAGVGYAGADFVFISFHLLFP
jgi:hypothetical protein